MKPVAVDLAMTNRTGSAPSRRSSNSGDKRLLEGIAVDCSICKDLERAFESSRGQYIEARSSAYYRVSTQLAASKNVDMERAKSDLEEYQLACKAGVGCWPRYWRPYERTLPRDGGVRLS